MGATRLCNCAAVSGVPCPEYWGAEPLLVAAGARLWYATAPVSEPITVKTRTLLKKKERLCLRNPTPVIFFLLHPRSSPMRCDRRHGACIRITCSDLCHGKRTVIF